LYARGELVSNYIQKCINLCIGIINVVNYHAYPLNSTMILYNYREDRKKVMAAKRSSAKFNAAIGRRGIKA
jgi:hypothetical protein